MSPPVLFLSLGRFEDGLKISQDRVGIDLEEDYTVTICRSNGELVEVSYRVVCCTALHFLCHVHKSPFVSRKPLLVTLELPPEADITSR